MSRQTIESVRNNVLFASYGCMKVSENPFVVQLHEIISQHPAAKYVNIGIMFGTLYKAEREKERPVGAPQARLTATEYTLEILDLVAHNLGIEVPEAEMLPTLADLGPKEYVPRKKV